VAVPGDPAQPIQIIDVLARPDCRTRCRAMYQDTASRLYYEEGPAGAASREACRGND
jgi:hypothetical protein